MNNTVEINLNNLDNYKQNVSTIVNLNSPIIDPITVITAEPSIINTSDPAIIITNTMITNKPLLQAKNPMILTPDKSSIISNISTTIIKTINNTIFIEKLKNKNSRLLAINYITGKLFRFIPVSIILKGLFVCIYKY